MSRVIDASAPVSDLGNIIVIGLGSRFRADDGVGPYVADRLRTDVEGLRIVAGPGDALALVGAWDTAALAVVVDAAASGSAAGTIHRWEAGIQPLPKDAARCSSHGLGLAEAIALAQALDRLPDRLVVYAVEGATFEHGTGLSPAVAAAAADVRQRIRADIAAFARDHAESNHA